MTDDTNSNKGTETKYTVPDGHWEKDAEDTTDAHPTQYIKSHEVDVYVDDEPDPEDNYDRTKYTAHITYRDDEPSALYVTTHRWKSNYWRDMMDLDWRDTPKIVKERVAAVVACDGVDDLDPNVRLVEEGGRNRWKDIHMPRVEASKRNDKRMESVETNIRDIVKDAANAAGIESPRLEGVDVDRAAEGDVTIHISEQDEE